MADGQVALVKRERPRASARPPPMKPQRRSIKYGCHRDPMPRHSKTCIRRFALGSRLRSVTNYGRELRPGDRGRQAEELSALAGLPGGARDVGGDDIDIRCDLVVK